MAELFDLLADVFEECVALPSAEQHDGEDWNIVKVHGHGCTRTDGVGTDIGGFESKPVFAKCVDYRAELDEDGFGGKF